MSLASLSVNNLRSLGQASLEFGQHLNLIHGPNGSGKTSILEAVFLIGRGRSFRTRATEQLISRGQSRLTVFGQTIDPAHRVGFEYRREEAYTARVDGQDVRSLAELPGAFFVEAIDPEIHRLVEGAPGSAAGGSTGVCSTWNLLSLSTGCASAERYASATRP